MKTPWKWLLLCSGLSLLPAAQAATDTKPLLAKQFKKTVGKCWVYTDGNDNDFCLSAGPSPFREVWNITRPRSGSGGWLVAGVQAMQ